MLKLLRLSQHCSFHKAQCAQKASFIQLCLRLLKFSMKMGEEFILEHAQNWKSLVHKIYVLFLFIFFSFFAAISLLPQMCVCGLCVCVFWEAHAKYETFWQLSKVCTYCYCMIEQKSNISIYSFFLFFFILGQILWIKGSVAFWVLASFAKVYVLNQNYTVVSEFKWHFSWEGTVTYLSLYVYIFQALPLPAFVFMPLPDRFMPLVVLAKHEGFNFCYNSMCSVVHNL